MRNNDTVFTLRLPVEVLEKIKQEADKYGASASWYVRLIINNELDRLARQAEQEKQNENN